MKKGQIIILFLAFVMSLSSLTLFNVKASERKKPHYDDAYGLLTDTEANELSGYLEKISEKRQCDVSIAIVNGFSGSDIEMYAHDFYDHYGYGYGEHDDGILLLVDMASRQWAVSTYGYGIEAFNDEGIDYIMDKVVGYLSDGDYQGAFYQFADSCDDFIAQARSGQAYFDGDTKVKEPIGIDKYLLLGAGSIFIGGILAFITMSFQKKALKSVYRATGATNYMSAEGLTLTNQQERFLGRSVHRQKRAQANSSSHRAGSSSRGTRTIRTSSSGRSHGGRSGRF